VDLGYDQFEFSGYRAATYFDFMEYERMFERDSVMLLSRSSVMASGETDFKKNLETVMLLRDEVDGMIPYLSAVTGGKSAAVHEREDAAKKFMDRARKILGEEGLKEYLDGKRK
jgi:hypothetical protein